MTFITAGGRGRSVSPKNGWLRENAAQATGRWQLHKHGGDATGGPPSGSCCCCCFGVLPVPHYEKQTTFFSHRGLLPAHACTASLAGAFGLLAATR